MSLMSLLSPAAREVWFLSSAELLDTSMLTAFHAHGGMPRVDQLEQSTQVLHVH